MSDWTQGGILSLARNFMESRVFLTGAELGVFDRLGAGPLSAEELASEIGADRRGLTILLDALAAMGLLAKRGGKYQCDSSAAPFLRSDAPESVLAMVLHAANLWDRWSDLTSIVGGCRAFEESPDASLWSFIEAMHVIGAPQAARIVALIEPGTARRLLDVGGASGTYTLAFLEAVPHMRATLFDRPQVIQIARTRLQAAGALDRVNLVAGDFYRDVLPPGHDLAFLSAVIHQNSPAENVDLFGKVFDALDSGGRIVIRDHVMQPDRTRPRAGALFAVNMLAGNTGGNSYTYEEIADALTRSGFTRIRLIHEDAHMDGLVEAYKP